MPTSHSTLRSIALDKPATIRVFEQYQLDYCCGGNRSVAEACAEKGLDESVVLAALTLAANTDESPARDFSRATLAELMRYIVDTHHAYIHRELQRLLPMARRVTEKHGSNHPEYFNIEDQLNQLAEELTSHLNKEEVILFPYIEALEKSRTGNAKLPHACFATVASPIQAMMQEHEGAAALMNAMRASTQGFTPPADACPTLVGFLDGLDAFERDLHEHVHLENNLLFPRAVEMEQQMRAA
jgi:regulator of cell morphogenesis and NO signaling